MSTRTRLAASCAAVAAAATIVFAGQASAAVPQAAGAGVVAPKVEGNFPISAPGCHVTEEIELQGSPAHDYMRWETTADSIGCSVWITDSSKVIEEQDDLATGYHRSNWYYDGPGHTLQVCVVSPTNGLVYCGPQN